MAIISSGVHKGIELTSLSGHTGGMFLCIAAAMLCSCGRGFIGQNEIYDHLQSEDPGVRIEAIHQAGEQKLVKAVPYLIDRLTDSEEEVRMFAIIALEKITGERRRYVYYAPAAERRRIADEWRKHWKAHVKMGQKAM